MSYFKKFPQYISRTVGNNQIIITDFFKRVGITQRAKNLSALLLPYIVLDGETPEMVANKFYGTPFYHWVLLLINDITDPRKEWPLESRYVIPFIFEKYNFELTVADISQYDIDDIITSEEGGKFIVVDVTDKVFIRSTEGITTIASTSILTNVTKDITDLTASQIIDPTEGVHHYIDITTELIVDNANNPNIVPVTNLQFEESENENKRRIRILDPQFLESFVRNFDNQINE